jgi:hypothetical protein
MWAALLGAVKAIPEIVGLVKQLVGAIDSMVSAYKKAQEEKWIAQGKELAKRIALAKTDAERAELVKKLSDSWNSLPGS